MLISAMCWNRNAYILIQDLYIDLCLGYSLIYRHQNIGLGHRYISVMVQPKGIISHVQVQLGNVSKGVIAFQVFKGYRIIRLYLVVGLEQQILVANRKRWFLQQAKGIKQQWVLYIGYSFQEELSRNKAHLSARPKGLTCYILMICIGVSTQVVYTCST